MSKYETLSWEEYHILPTVLKLSYNRFVQNSQGRLIHRNIFISCIKFLSEKRFSMKMPLDQLMIFSDICKTYNCNISSSNGFWRTIHLCIKYAVPKIATKMPAYIGSWNKTKIFHIMIYFLHRLLYVWNKWKILIWSILLISIVKF